MGISAFSFWLFAGWFFFMVLPGLASADDVAQLRMEAKEERIMNRHRDFCLANQGSEQARYFLNRRNELIREYEDIEGVRFDFDRLPDCDMLRPVIAGADANNEEG